MSESDYAKSAGNPVAVAEELQDNYSLPISFLGAFLVCGALILFGCLLTRYFIYRPGHDQSIYLFEAQRLLDGVELYGPRLVETNPPIIIWFSAIPVLLAHWMHASPALLFGLIILAMLFASVAWCVRILRRSPALTNPVAIGLLGCAILAIEFSIGTYDFGQREHLLIILILPYLLAAATGAVNRLSVAERCALGGAAGIAIWFKPHDTLVLVGLELVLALRARSLRRVLAPELLAAFLTSSLLLLLVRFYAPLYGKSTLPLLFDTYWGMGTATTLVLAFRLRHFMAEAFVILLGCLLLRRSLRDPATTVAFIVSTVAASFAFDLQRTDWRYHMYPHQALFLVTVAYFLTDLLYPVIVDVTSDTRVVRSIMLVTAAAMAVLLCAIAIHPRLALPDPHRAQYRELDPFFSQLKPATTVYVFSTRVGPLSAAYNRGLNWGSRFAALWMMPAIIQNELGPTGPPAPFKRLSPDTLSRLANLQRAESTDDLNYWHPSFVLVEHCTLKHPCQGIEGKDFDMLAWFLRSPDFAAAWSHYQRRPSVEDFDVYELVPSSSS